MNRLSVRTTLLCLFILLGAACTELATEPTATRIGENAPTLAPSEVFYPAIATQSPDDFVGRNNPTAAALAAEGHPTDDPGTLVVPTQSVIPITVYASDGVLLHADFYGAPVQPAPALLLLHGEDGAITESSRLAQRLRDSGYNVMVLALRGYGSSSGRVDWTSATEDIRAALDTMNALPNILNVATIGEGTGAIAGSLACEQHVNCLAAVAIDPVIREEVTSLEAVEQLQLPLLVLLNETLAEQTGSGLPGTGRTVKVYSTVSTSITSILEWLAIYLAL